VKPLKYYHGAGGTKLLYVGELLQAFAVRYANVQIIRYLAMMGMPRTNDAEEYVTDYLANEHTTYGKPATGSAMLAVIQSAVSFGQRTYRQSLLKILTISLHKDTMMLVYQYLVDEAAQVTFEEEAAETREHVSRRYPDHGDPYYDDIDDPSYAISLFDEF
jgi:hypothetical protein